MVGNRARVALLLAITTCCITTTAIAQQYPSRTVRIASGKEIYIRTTARGQGTAPAYSCGGQVCMELRECSSYLSFVPEAGKTYDIHQVWTSAGCGTKLIEDPTRLAPASMRFHSERTNLCPPGAKFFKK